MDNYLKTGDKVKLLPKDKFKAVLELRNFCSNDKTRQIVANEIGGKHGIVKSVEERYRYDYFFFIPDDNNETYSIPYQSVEW